MANKFITGVLSAVEDLKDGSEVTMRVLVKKDRFLLRLNASDGKNNVDAEFFDKEAEEVYRFILQGVKDA